MAKVKEFALGLQPPATSTPKPALKKREAKADSKKLAVKFNDNVQVHTFWQRNWNDYKKREMLRGPFSESEVNKLVTALCEFAAQQEDPKDILKTLCSNS